MLSSVLLAPVSYFETTPLGRILNRFTYDVEVIDITLTESMSILMIGFGWFFTGIIVMISILPWMALAVFPAIIMYWLLSLHYRKCGTDLQRLDAVARSPIQAIVSEGTCMGDCRFGNLENFCSIWLLLLLDRFGRIYHNSYFWASRHICIHLLWCSRRKQFCTSELCVSSTVAGFKN